MSLLVTVAGLAGTGKSRVVDLICRTLRAEGITVTKNDDGDTEVHKENAALARLPAASGHQHVHVESRFANRDAFKQEFDREPGGFTYLARIQQLSDQLDAAKAFAAQMDKFDWKTGDLRYPKEAHASYVAGLRAELAAVMKPWREGSGQQEHPVTGLRDDEMVLTLAIKVRYEMGRTTPAELADVLVKAADHLANHGLLSGSTEASVTSWTSEVLGLPHKEQA